MWTVRLTARRTCIELAALDVSVSLIGYRIIRLDLLIESFVVTGKNGIAVNLIDSDENMQICQDIERHFGKKIAKIDTDNPEEIENIQS